MTDPTQDLKFRDLDRRDRQHGLAKIGYHFVIDREGKVSTGRTQLEASVHDSFNIAKDAMSICLVGGVDASKQPANNFTDEQFDSLVHLVSNLRLGTPTIKSIKLVTLAMSEDELRRWIQF